MMATLQQEDIIVQLKLEAPRQTQFPGNDTGMLQYLEILSPASKYVMRGALLLP